MSHQVNYPVFLISAALVIFLVLIGVLYTETLEEIITIINDGINTYFGWFLIISVSIFLVFVIYLMFSKYGNVRLSPDDSRPRYSFFTWLAMLFSAGMGIGLLFYGVAEPMIHYAAPPIGEGQTQEAAQLAMDFSFLHWGFHAWATYIIIGLSVAYFSYRRGYPLSIKYIFYPVFGNRIYGPVGNTIEILAIIGTLFGVATSLGLGAMQINAGLDYLFGIEPSTFVQIILIVIITLIALVSVASGVNKGIKWLSVFNVNVGAFLLLFVIIAGPTIFILQAFLQNIGNFLDNFITLSLWNQAFSDTEINWQSAWTIFYWSWWIAWSPYVGIFIARISKGRTIKEFIAGVLFIPTLFSFLWLTAFGSTGIFLEMEGNAEILPAIQDGIESGLYIFLEQFPLPTIVSVLATIVIVSFFVTSSDSGSLVIGMISSGGASNPLLSQRVFWAIIQGCVAAVLLLGGGLVALQTAAISMGLPFAVVLLILCYSLYKELKTENI
ncbi:MAG: BCCT family transporter [Nanoarchaeota archaeon]